LLIEADCNHISERLIIIYVQILSSGKKTHRPVPRRVNKSKNNITETDFFSHTEYAIPWNQLRSMWILYFGVQDEFPEGVGLKEIRKAFRTCERFENNPGVNVNQICQWKEKFRRWISLVELNQEDVEPGN
jgi:hypothetical protein